VFDRYLERAAQMGAKASPEMLKVLLEADWVGIKNGGEVVEQHARHFGKDSFEVKWLKENAGNGREGLDKKMAGLGKERPRELKGEIEKEEEIARQGSWKKGGIGGSGGRKESKGEVRGDPKQGPNPEQIQKWFRDVPW
jgi:hypothetical protein